MPTYRMTLEFDGTRYHGWQEQRNARGVASELRAAVERSGERVVDLGGAGRTDAGVHALAQSAHLRLGRAIDPEGLRRAVNEELPADVHVLSIVPESDRFHARHSALSRSYLYQVSRRRTAFGKRFVWWVRRPLDEARMAAAARLLVGRHDFSGFCERAEEHGSTTVVVDAAEVAASGDLILVRIVASHFLRKMVRRLVGAVVQVGAGEIGPAELLALVRGRPPGALEGKVAEWTAPPSGLFLERVLYPGDPPLPPIAPAFPVTAEGAHETGSRRAIAPGRSRIASSPRPRRGRPGPPRGR